MRIAVFSDVHGNYELLDKTLNGISAMNADEVICLGDTLGKGPESLRAMRRIISEGITTVQGNWEMYYNRGYEKFKYEINQDDFYKEFTSQLTPEEDKWIRNLPWEHVVEVDNRRILFMHFPLEDLDRNYPFYFLKRLRDGSIQAVFDEMDYDMMVFGHAHISSTMGKVVLIPSTLSEQYEFLIIDVQDGEIEYSRHIVR